MVQLDEMEFDQLKHDADDNNAMRAIAKIIMIGVIIIVLTCTIVLPIFNLWLDTQKTNLDIQSQKLQAMVNLEVKEIESDNMTNEEYFRWLEVRNK